MEKHMKQEMTELFCGGFDDDSNSNSGSETEGKKQLIPGIENL